MKTADTLGYLIRVWLSRQQAHLPEFIFFYLRMYKCLKNMEPSNPYYFCEDFLSLFKTSGA